MEAGTMTRENGDRCGRGRKIPLRHKGQKGGGDDRVG